MRVFWEHAPQNGSIWLLDVLDRGMRYLTDEVSPKKCPTCHRPFPPDRRGLRWQSLDVGCKPARFYPRMFDLPPRLKPLGDRPEPRVRAFLERATKLLRRKDGMLFVWWRIEGDYLLLSPYWSPTAGGLEWAMSTPPGPKYPRRV